jgi:hypothetical protein
VGLTRWLTGWDAPFRAGGANGKVSSAEGGASGKAVAIAFLDFQANGNGTLVPLLKRSRKRGVNGSQALASGPSEAQRAPTEERTANVWRLKDRTFWRERTILYRVDKAAPDLGQAATNLSCLRFRALLARY